MCKCNLYNNQYGMDSMIGDITSQSLKLIYKETQKEHNKIRIRNIISNITKSALTVFQPYFYAIMGILILMFLANCFQFYYYIKTFASLDIKAQLNESLQCTL